MEGAWVRSSIAVVDDPAEVIGTIAKNGTTVVIVVSGLSWVAAVKALGLDAVTDSN